MSTGRNHPCPCGSGEKYKRCCEVQRSSAFTPGILILAVMVLIGTAITVTAMIDAPEPPDQQQVWSEEHGHWHNVNQESGIVPRAGELTPAPGPPPPGKVWSAEHGHWHDAS